MGQTAYLGNYFAIKVSMFCKKKLQNLELSKENGVII